MTQGLVVMPGEGERVGTDTINLIFKVTGAHAQHASVYENIVVPGFDVGAHLHDRIEECFYILEGELEVFAFEPQHRTGEDWGAWQAEDGQRPVRAGTGACVYVPPGCPHAFRNTGDAPARFLGITSPPPEHELYLKEVAGMFARGGDVSQEEIIRVREAYDTHQLTPLKAPS
ncbi:cupin domain-containing protein [Streptomyces sp. NPDC003006]